MTGSNAAQMLRSVENSSCIFVPYGKHFSIFFYLRFPSLPPKKIQKENQNLILLAQMCSRTRYSRKLERLISDGKISKVIVFVLLFFFPPATEIGYMLQNLIKDINLDSKVRKAMECRQVLENAFK